MRVRLLLLFALAIGTASGGLLLQQRGQEGTGLHVLDIGQGDSILLRSGDVDVLVDTTISTRSR
ncbi:MAG: hypothetical protein G01um101438_895 [Parcubacteria group bacterium Gr01-1014_38]|nr:MAG: hypothetical protein G01um101438_895 [Parcubacteria group bacterium Gr01-1014_38]